MSPNKHIFIHIPKTGGTTLNCAIHGSDWQTTPDFNYRHIIYDTKASNSGDIFDPINHEKYQSHKLFSILRDPVDRLVSEYYFLKDRKEFISLIDRKPKDLLAYAKNKQTQNYMTSFLLGRRIFGRKPINESHLHQVLTTIDTLPIYMGLFEEYQKSLSYLSHHLSIQWPKKIAVKRITLNRPKFSDLSLDIKEEIRSYNPLDQKLYDHCKAKLDLFNETPTNSVFEADKYAYVMKYTQRFNLFELYLTDKKFLQRNQAFFAALNQYIHQSIPKQAGRDYVLTWNKNFIKAANDSLKQWVAPQNNTDDPLTHAEVICKSLDQFLDQHPSKKNTILPLSTFELVREKPKSKGLASLFKKTKGLWSKS